jgi:DNA-binding winged helix-turn-helix (wHTH) protein/tetratricopeptide (TPR) repeat protein
LSQLLYRFHDFTLDPAARHLVWRDQPLPLPAKQFDLLLAFVQRAGRPVDKKELRDLVWPDVHVEENNLTQHVFQLRKALASVAGSVPFLETLPKTGYQFVAPVETLPAPAAPVLDLAPAQVPVRQRIPWWLIGTAAAALLLVTLSYGRRQWEFWMAEDEPVAKAAPSVLIHPLSGPAGAAISAEVAAGLGRMDGIQVRVVQPMSGSSAGDFNLSGSIQGQSLTAEFKRNNGEVIWQRQWSGSASELAEICAELIAQTAISLEELAGARRRALTGRKPPANPEAYAAYLDGVQHLLARKSLESGPAIAAFQRALLADPGFSSAYAGMALAYAWQGINQAESPQVVWPRARELAQHAVKLDAANGEARMVQAMVLAYADQNEAEAEVLVRGVLASDPSSVHLQVLAGQLLSRFGRFAEAETLLKRAIQADPAFTLTRQILAFHYYQSRQFDLSKREAWRIIRANPRSGSGYGLLVPPMWMTGDWRTASWIVSRAESAGLNQPMLRMGLAYTYGRSGRLDDAKRILQAMDDQAKMVYVSPYQRAIAHMGLGHNDEAVGLIRACLAAGCINPSAPRFEPVFDPLRQRADFSSLVQ